MIKIKTLPTLDAFVRIPGSKSLTQRAMVVAALAEGESLLRNVLVSEDTLALADALRSFNVDIRQDGTDMVVRGVGGAVSGTSDPIYLGNNGTALRLLTGVASLGKGPFTLTGDRRLCERPLKPLLDALGELGVACDTNENRGYPPVTIRGGRLRGGSIVLRDIPSSQFVSSLLIAAPYASGDIEIVLEGNIPSLPYIALTIETMEAFGVSVYQEDRRYRIKGKQCYHGREHGIEGDASSASYFFLAAALTKGRVRVGNIARKTRQGDIGFLSILEDLGCQIYCGDNFIEVRGGELPGGDMTFDLGEMPDIVPTLAVLCAMRPGQSTIRNVAHLRLKESDRIAALAAELQKTGISAGELPDGLIINGGHPHGARIKTYNDHRIAMGFAIMGLCVPSIEIENEACIGKSFPGFLKVLGELY